MTQVYAVNSLRRRALLQAGVAFAAGTVLGPVRARADDGPVMLGTLTPLTGSGGTYGPSMRDAAALVVAEVNAAGGVLGRQIRLVSEDDETNPDAGVRAARKLIDVDRVSAIIGTWASSVTSAVAPLCWESKTFLTTTSGADSITRLPHDGYLIRTQPDTELQGRKFGQLALDVGAKKLVFLGPQTPFAQSTADSIAAAVKPSGGTLSTIIYDGAKTSYRSEVDAAIRAQPDTIVLGGYVSDTTIVLKDLYRADFRGHLIAFGYAITPKLLSELQPEIVEGLYALSPSPAVGSTAYTRLARLLAKGDDVDTYTAQVYDQTNLVILAMAAAGGTTGTDVRRAVRLVSQGNGPVVDNAVDGLKALASGAKELNYEGASGPCTFDAIGDIVAAHFRFDRVQGGKLVLLRID
jgi:branched-chain amino acid transport system substrate-binding protein